MPKAKKPKPKSDQGAQSKRFIDTARKLGADESGKPFERALGILTPPSKRTKRP